MGGIQLPGDRSYVHPRYRRVYPCKEQVLRQLDVWAERARGRGIYKYSPITVDVLVPSFRAPIKSLEEVMLRCSTCSSLDTGIADIRFGIVIDDPDCSWDTKKKLLEIQECPQWTGKLRLRFNATNLGASGTR